MVQTAVVLFLKGALSLGPVHHSGQAFSPDLKTSQRPLNSKMFHFVLT
jgi:hypothetical protein